MKKFLVILALFCICISCTTTKKFSAAPAKPTIPAVKVNQTTPVVTTNQTPPSQAGVKEGTSFERAIVIMEKTERTGVAAEYTWLRQNYPGFQMKKQVLSFHEKKNYDILDIVTSDGKAMSIYFDISNFFGKY